MNCGNIKCAYECVQRDKEIEKQKTQRIQGIVYGIRDLVINLKDNSMIIHKKVDKSRRFYRIKNRDNFFNFCLI